MSPYDDLIAELAPLGLLARGGFRPDPADGLHGIAAVVMIGNAGPALWRIFAVERRDEADPLDSWVRRRLTPVADAVGAWVVLPNDGPPYHPFQRWAQRSAAVHPSPLGLLIDPEFGLWHAYRAALLFPADIELPARRERANPCDACPGRPCLAACPVGAFSGGGYDVAACRGHAASPQGDVCRSGGCLARHACPVGCDDAYGAEQQAFHMAAFLP